VHLAGQLILCSEGAIGSVGHVGNRGDAQRGKQDGFIGGRRQEQMGGRVVVDRARARD
jgi:hypothetical protein